MLVPTITVVAEPPPGVLTPPGVVSIDCRNYGAIPDSDKDAAGGFNSAYAAAVAAKLPLLVPPGKYLVFSPVNWTSTQRVDVMAAGAVWNWRGGANVALTYGGTAGTPIYAPRLTGLSLDSGHAEGSTAIVITNVECATIDMEFINGFGVGVKLFGNNAPVAYSRLRFTLGCDVDAVGVTAQQVGKGWVNRLTFFDCKIGGGKTMISLPGRTVHGYGGWVWTGCSFESNHAVTLVDGERLAAWVFTDCWFEATPPMPLKLDKKSSITIRGGVTSGLALTPLPQGVTLAP
jgi:hypothetical protein